MACMTETATSSNSPEKEKPIPRRNLTQAFEALCVEDDNNNTPSLVSPPNHKQTSALISPTGVADLQQHQPTVPYFDLHPELRRELSQALVNRVSFYGTIHDINKEATLMASNDPYANQSFEPDLAKEAESPLVQAATGTTVTNTTSATTTMACIDEEEWLLKTIAQAKEARRSCDTFLQAMGEKEYYKMRTQLWKPSRSWWEAKSGRNPWIEPASHNKRWRYLWPLIHYHKFLAKCVKKLKRNGVDVKQSVSPVAVFLREEVCAVSDHLAAVSLFGSDEWMHCLEHFDGWTDTSAEGEERLRAQVALLKLRPLSEPGDVDSPLLRSQIDEHFLRAMAATRNQMRETAAKSKKTPAASSTAPVAAAVGQPPMYPKPAAGSPQVPKQIAGVRRPRWGYQWGYGWMEQQQHPHMDNSSVHSGLSADTGSFPPQQQQYMYHGQMYYPRYSSDVSQVSNEMYHGWMDPAMVYHMQQQQEAYYGPPQPGTPPTMPHSPYHAENQAETHEQSTSYHSPYKPPSPYWSHLDHATLTMGLATPAKASPSTPPRNRSDDKRDDELESSDEGKGFLNAQPPLLRQQYYGYPYGARDGYGPPSPATQFMMSPQASFAYNYGYGFSPRRPRSTPRSSNRTVPTLTPPPPSKKPDRESPSTVASTTETESEST